MADIVHLPVHPKPHAVPGPAKRQAAPPRALLQRAARDAYWRGVQAERNRRDLVALMPGRWARLVDRVHDWLGKDGRADILLAVLIVGAALTAAASVIMAVLAAVL
jgi:hypothetical protein